jgi:hypothetical protein
MIVHASLISVLIITVLVLITITDRNFSERFFVEMQA